MRYLLISLPVFLFAALSLHAQKIDRNAFSEIDSYVVRCGPMPGLRLASIVDSVSAPCREEVCKLRGIYRWITKYIAVDAAASKRPEKHNNQAWVTLRDRAANSVGYAALFQEMCDYAHIACATVTGQAKAFPESISSVDARDEHSWNSVKIKDQTYLLDLAWSAGQVDKGYKNFDNRYLFDGWFMTDKRLFALSHFPDDKALQADMLPVTRRMFEQAPVIRSGAVTQAVYPYSSEVGRLRARKKSCLRLQYYTDQPEKIRAVFYGQSQEAADVVADAFLAGNRLYVDVQLEETGAQELWIRINDDVAFGYWVEVRK